MPKRAKPRSTDVSLSYLNNVNAEPKRRRTGNEPTIYDFPTSPEQPRDTRKVRHARLSEPATRFTNLRNRQKGVDPSQQSATPRSPSNEEQESPNDAQSEADDNQSAESENIDESTGSHRTQNETENIGGHQADDSDERQPTTPVPAIYSGIEGLFLPKGAQEEGQEPGNGGFVSINGPRRVSSRNSRSRPRASDLFPAKLPEMTGAQNDGDENSSPVSVDGYSHGNHGGSESVESDISEEIVKEQPDSDKNSVGEEEEEEEEEEEDDDADEENPIHHPVNLFSDEAEPEAQDGPDEDVSEEFHSPIPARHPASQSPVEVQVPIRTNGSWRDGTRRNQAGTNKSLSSQIGYRNQVPETPAQPRGRRRDHDTRKEDAADRPTASSRRNESLDRRPCPVPVEDHEVRLGIFSWLNDTVKESGFKEDWQIICRPRKVLKLRADFFMKDRFTGPSKLIQRLRDLYKIMAREPYSANSSMTDRCRLIANSIFNEGQLVLIEEALEYENEETGGHLINQFEAHIVPDLIKLLIVAFKTYKTVGDGAKPHLRIALDLLWAICHRISSIQDVDDRIGPYVQATSHEVLSHIKVVKDALNDGRLHERLNLANRIPRRYKHFELTEVQSNITCDPWTGSEKQALLEGLNGFSDSKSQLKYSFWSRFRYIF
jgi:hypothetical protein